MLVAAFAPCAAFAAGDSTVYAVHGIQVDATAENAAAARDKAIAQGARKGLEQLMKNLTLSEDAKSLPVVTDKMAAPLVLDFDVESERGSSVRYIASLGFRYKPDGVRALLASAKSSYVANRAPLVLVVPVYRSATGDMLWQPDNLWRNAWKDAAAKAGLVPVVAPTGSAEDVQGFTTGDLMNGAKLSDLAARYKADNAVIVIASAASPTGDPALGLNIILTGGGGPDATLKSPGASTPALTLDQGVVATLADLDAIWRQHVLKGTTGAIAFTGGSSPQSTDAAGAEPEKPSGNVYALRAVLTAPGQWASLRTRLTQMNGISHVDLKSLTREAAIVDVNISGDEDRLAQTLSAGGMLLGAPEAVPSGDNELASMVPNTGPGAGLIYPISATDQTP